MITHELLHEFSEEDLEIIKKDWVYIVNQIKLGKAHELSEGDTMYLGACPKGVNAKSKRQQPFSDILAMQRAFSLKNSYMTQLVRKYIGKAEDVESILKDKKISFNDYINQVVNKYKNYKVSTLKTFFDIEGNSKSINNILISRMFGSENLLQNTEEFLKAGIVPKTIRINKNNSIKESMSFAAFNFNQVVKEEWENSRIRNIFENKKFMFFIFKEEDNDYVFKGIKLWNIPENIIETELKEVWKKLREVLNSGEIVKEIDNQGRRITNFPGLSFNDYFHVRPHARNSLDTHKLPYPDKLTGAKEYTKHSFWINSSYLEKIIIDSDS